MKNVLIICGSTGTGKTGLGLRLAKKFKGEVVSADSRQIYKYMNIGTGKDLPSNSEIYKTGNKININNKNYQLNYYLLDSVKLWLHDLVEPDEEFSVSYYQKLAYLVIDNILSRGKLPIIVGGTGLYIKSIMDHIDTINIRQNKSLRKKLETKSVGFLQNLLEKEDVKTWSNLNKSDRNNPRRLVRKIEIAMYKKENKDKKVNSKKNSYNFFMIGLTSDNKYLYERIDERVDKRVSQGVIKEILNLLTRGYSWALPSMSALGYKQWKEYFTKRNKDNNLLDKIIKKWKHDEHSYARRQLTWFKKDSRVVWFDIARKGWETKVDESVRQWYTDN